MKTKSFMSTRKFPILGLATLLAGLTGWLTSLGQDAEEYAQRNLRDAAVAAAGPRQNQPQADPYGQPPSFAGAATIAGDPAQWVLGVSQSNHSGFSGFNVQSAPAAIAGQYFANQISGPNKATLEQNKKIAMLTNELRGADSDEEKQKIKDELKTELEKQYDLYLEQHEQPLKQLEERLAKLREEFEWRKNARNDLVKLRLDTIWYDSQGLGWPGQSNNVLYRDNVNPFSPAAAPRPSPLPSISTSNPEPREPRYQGPLGGRTGR